MCVGVAVVYGPMCGCVGFVVYSACLWGVVSLWPS